jgi:predicted ATPase
VLTGPLHPLAIPATLHDSLMARLDRLAAVKALAQLGATLGREFSYALLRAVAPWEEEIVHQGLHQLVAAEFLYQRGVPPQATYTFKHALIQEVAYQSLLRSTRQQYHKRIAQILEERFPTLCETQPELLVHHYTETGVLAQAIPYRQQAGQRALQRSANLEAISHLTKGLELLALLPDSLESTQHELMLQTTLGPALIATKGQGAPEVEHTYARARNLCRQVGETPRLFPVLRGLWSFYLVRAELQTARELGEQLLRLAQRPQDHALLLEVARVLGSTLFWVRDFTQARAQLEQGVTFYDPVQHRSLAFAYGQDPRVVCQCYAVWTLWMLGYPDQALKLSAETVAMAQELAHPLSLVYARQFTAVLDQYRQERLACQEQAEAVIALSREQGFVQWLAQGTAVQGWALTAQGQSAEGIAQMHEALAAYRATGSEISRLYYLALLAEAYGAGGQAQEGLEVLAEAVAIASKNGPYYWEAELHRQKGELLRALSASHTDEAATCLQQALAVARRHEPQSPLAAAGQAG